MPKIFIKKLLRELRSLEIFFEVTKNSEVTVYCTRTTKKKKKVTLYIESYLICVHFCGFGAR